MPTRISQRRLATVLVLAHALAACGGDGPSGPDHDGDEPEPSVWEPGYGPGVSLDGARPFPDDNWWNRDVSADPVDPNFRLRRRERSRSVSDPGPYPIPPDAPIEGGRQGDGDRHVLIVDRDNWILYELFDAHPRERGTRWEAGSGAIFDLSTNALRPAVVEMGEVVTP